MRDAFEEFMAKNYNTFMAYCMAWGQNVADADEIVDEAFVRLYAHWSERSLYDEIHNRKWMYNAIQYIILEYDRKNQKHIAENIEDYTDILIEERTSVGADVGEDLQYAEFVQMIADGLRKNDKTLFYMAYIEEKSYAEICKILGISSQSLRTRISRLKKRIEKILKK